MTPAQIRANLLQAIEGTAWTLESLSKKVGRNPAYLQQFIQRGTPKRLPEDVRLSIAMLLRIDERELGARDPWSPS